MKICFVSKFPPIQGGESSKAYWLTKALGSRNHDIHVVTNALEVENEYREVFSADDLDSYQPVNVTLHNTDPFSDPQFIPYSNPHVAKLASYSIDIVRHFKIQVLDTWYLLPYGVAGYIAKNVTKLPNVLRHAGSDMSRLFASPYLGTLFKEIIHDANKIVTYPNTKNRFLSFGVSPDKLFINSSVSVDTDSFNPNVAPFDLSLITKKNYLSPVITYFGKANKSKGIYELIEALSEIKKDFLLLFVSGGREIKNVKNFVKSKNIDSRTEFISFVPPWKMPSLIKSSTCVVHPERNFPVAAHTPILPREVMSVGTCLILSEELYSKYPHLKNRSGKSLLTVSPKNISEFRKILKMVIDYPQHAKDIGHSGYQLSKRIEKFTAYIDKTEELYKKLIAISDYPAKSRSRSKAIT